MSRRRAGVGVALLLFAAGCATSGRDPDVGSADLEGWLELRSPLFVLSGDVPREELERLAEDLAVFVAVVERITNARAGAARVPARVYLVDGRVAQVLKPWTGIVGYMQQRLDGYYCVVGRSTFAPITRATLLHEYTHFLLRKGRALDYPLWYDEGFAEVLSTTRRRDDFVTIGTPAAGRLRTLARIDEIDLEAVFAPRQRADIEDAELFYALAWGVTHYFATHGEIERMGLFVELQGQGLDWQVAYARAFAVPLADLERELRRHIDSLARGALVTVASFDADDLAWQRDWEIRELAPAEVARRLGELGLAVFDEEDEAGVPAAFFARALEIDPDDAQARAGLAVARALQGRFEAATAELALALAARRDDPVVALAEGRVERARAAVDGAASEHRLRARAAYERVTQLDPEGPSGWAGLGWSYVGGNDPAAGIAALARASSTGAWDPDVALDLGRLYRQAGDVARARELWMQVARLGAEGLAEEAERLLTGLPADHSVP